MNRRIEKNPGERFQVLPLQEGETIPEVSSIGLHKRMNRGVLPDVPPLAKLKPGIVVTPDASNINANKGLFMLSLAEYEGRIHALARAIGSANKGYQSRIIHGVMQDDHSFKFDRTPILDEQCREDPRLVKINGTYYFTHTVVDDKGIFSVGLASTRDFERYTDHGIVIPNLGDAYCCKDPAIHPDTANGILMQTRLRPGIQLVRFDNIEQLVELGGNPGKRQKFWDEFIAKYRENPEEYDILTPEMPVMQPFEDRWRPALNQLVDHQLLPSHPDFKHLTRHPERGKTWYGNGPAPVKTNAGWLEFPHRGEVIAQYTPERKAQLERTGYRVDDIKLYTIFATLRSLNNPRQLIAVSPDFISTPDPKNPRENQLQYHPLAVPYVKITSGAIKTSINGEPHILLPAGVDDTYTMPEYIPLNGKTGLIPWMLKHGKIQK